MELTPALLSHASACPEAELHHVLAFAALVGVYLDEVMSVA